MKKIIILTPVLILLLTIILIKPVIAINNLDSKQSIRMNRINKSQEIIQKTQQQVKTRRCENAKNQYNRIKNRITTRKNDRVIRYQQISQRISNIINKINNAKCNTDLIKQDLNVLDQKIQQYQKTRVNATKELSDVFDKYQVLMCSKDLKVANYNTEIRDEINGLKTQYQLEFQNHVSEIHKYIRTTLISDIKTIRNQCINTDKSSTEEE